MRRDKRRKEEDSFKSLMYMSGSILVIAIIAFVITFVLYGNKIKKDSQIGDLSAEEISQIGSSLNEAIGDTLETEEASSQLGKKVEESKNEISQSNIRNEVNNTVETVEKKQNTNTSNDSKNDTKKNTSSKVTKNENTEVNNTKDEEKKENELKEIKFLAPVEGEILRGYAKEQLVYSETLKEWVTHTGIDIKAEKTSVVKSVADGTVKCIKNDPRYGLTVVVEHENNMKTVYSNLLTAEFVIEGESITQGQTIGTIGNSSSFESVEDYHLHFEIIKDGEYVDPEIYII